MSRRRFIRFTLKPHRAFSWVSRFSPVYLIYFLLSGKFAEISCYGGECENSRRISPFRFFFGFGIGFFFFYSDCWHLCISLLYYFIYLFIRWFIHLWVCYFLRFYYSLYFLKFSIFSRHKFSVFVHFMLPVGDGGTSALFSDTVLITVNVPHSRRAGTYFLSFCN